MQVQKWPAYLRGAQYSESQWLRTSVRRKTQLQVVGLDFGYAPLQDLSDPVAGSKVAGTPMV